MNKSKILRLFKISLIIPMATILVSCVQAPKQVYKPSTLEKIFASTGSSQALSQVPGTANVIQLSPTTQLVNQYVVQQHVNKTSSSDKNYKPQQILVVTCKDPNSKDCKKEQQEALNKALALQDVLETNSLLVQRTSVNSFTQLPYLPLTESALPTQLRAILKNVKLTPEQIQTLLQIVQKQYYANGQLSLKQLTLQEIAFLQSLASRIDNKVSVDARRLDVIDATQKLKTAELVISLLQLLAI